MAEQQGPHSDICIYFTYDHIHTSPYSLKARNASGSKTGVLSTALLSRSLFLAI